MMQTKKGLEDWVNMAIILVIAVIFVYLMFAIGVPFISKITQSSFGGG